MSLSEEISSFGELFFPFRVGVVKFGERAEEPREAHGLPVFGEFFGTLAVVRSLRKVENAHHAFLLRMMRAVVGDHKRVLGDDWRKRGLVPRGFNSRQAFLWQRRGVYTSRVKSNGDNCVVPPSPSTP